MLICYCYFILQIKENDTLPKGICEGCTAKIEEFYDFIKQCTNTESMLKSYCSTLSVSDQSKCQGKVSCVCTPLRNVVPEFFIFK